MDGLVRFLQIEQETQPLYQPITDKEKLIVEKMKQYRRFYLIMEKPNLSNIFFNAQICEYGLHLYGINSHSPINELFVRIDEVAIETTGQDDIDVLVDGGSYNLYGVKNL